MGYTNEMEKWTRNDSKLLLTIELNNPLARKMWLRVLGYSMGEYLHILGNGGLTLKDNTYSIVSQENDLEEWEGGGGEREKRKQKEGSLDAIDALVRT